MLREKLRNKKGFTLIEIIVVIVILAVLMAVAVPSVMSYINEGNDSRYKTVARSVLINAQTEYAKAVADGQDNETAKDTAKANASVKEGQTSKHNYGDGVLVDVTEIDTTNGSTNSEDAKDYDVSKVVCTIKMSNDDTKGKTATIIPNKDVELS